MSPPKIGNETRMSPLFTSVQRGTGGPTRDSWARKERKGTRTGKEAAKLSLFTEDMTSCTENPKAHTRAHTESMSTAKLQIQDTKIGCISIHWQ